MLKVLRSRCSQCLDFADWANFFRYIVWRLNPACSLAARCRAELPPKWNNFNAQSRSSSEHTKIVGLPVSSARSEEVAAALFGNRATSKQIRHVAALPLQFDFAKLKTGIPRICPASCCASRKMRVFNGCNGLRTSVLASRPMVGYTNESVRKSRHTRRAEQALCPVPET